MSGYLLDTHILLWLAADRKDLLSAEALEEIEQWQRQAVLWLSVESVWEVALLVSLKRLALGGTVEAWLQTLTEDRGFQVAALSPQVLIQSVQLPGVVHRDPSDRKLLATALVHGLTLVTRDRLMVEYGRQGFVRVLER